LKDNKESGLEKCSMGPKFLNLCSNVSCIFTGLKVPFQHETCKYVSKPRRCVEALNARKKIKDIPCKTYKENE
jgi:hypothetical protein